MRSVQVKWPVAVFGSAIFMLLGAAAAYYVGLPGQSPAAVRVAATVVTPPAATVARLPDLAVVLSEDAVAKAGVVVSPVTVSNIAARIRLSGIVEPDAYRQVVVSPLVSGRVTRVPVTLGERVARNTPLAEIHSPDLAEAQTRFLSTRAEFQAVAREIVRTERLVEIGAASQEELERIHAEHVRHRTEVESAKARMQLLGMTSRQIEALTTTGQVTATTIVVSPLAGTVTARTVNPGASVNAATALVTVVDLSTVWIVADLYERDVSLVSIGTPAVVTTAAYPDQRMTGKVAYLDPQVRSETRTARVRIDLPNPGQRLRLGMYADVQLEVPGATTETVWVPRQAIQVVADRTVLYVMDSSQPGRFIEREVRLGEVSGDQVTVLTGAQRGDQVVTRGSFSLRAEGERLGLRRFSQPTN